MEERRRLLLASFPENFFIEERFKRRGSDIAAAKLNLDFSKINESEMMNCSPLLKKDQEILLFKKYNYFRYRIVSTIAGRNWQKIIKNQKEIEKRISRMNSEKLDQAEKFVNLACEIRNIILKANMRLMLRPVSRYEPQESTRKEELLSNACTYIIRAINCFDYRRGIKFSTYCVNAIKNNLLRDFVTERNKRSRHWGEMEEDGEKNIISKPETNKEYDAEFISRAFESLDKDHKIIIKGSFGIDSKKMTVKELASRLGIARYLVYKMKESALRKMSEIEYDPSF